MDAVPFQLRSLHSRIATSLDAEEIERDLEAVAGLRQGVGEGDERALRIQGVALAALQAGEKRQKLLGNRPSLYGRVQLPEAPLPLPLLLKKVSEEHPPLEDGCARFESLLASVLRLPKASRPLTKGDVEFLEGFRSAVEGQLGDQHPLYRSVDALWEKIVVSIQSKRCLWEELARTVDRDRPFEAWAVEEQIRWMVRAEQILRNPFEPSFDLEDLLEWIGGEEPLSALVRRLEGEPIAHRGRKEFWDHFSPLERRAHHLANSVDGGGEILRVSKKEGLRAIARRVRGGGEEEHLILGAGPAGLIHALSFALEGKRFRIVEKRSQEKIPRENTVTFGKWEPKELQILMFCGALADLEPRISFGHNRSHYTETALGDLEWALTEALSVLCEEIPIDYETEVVAIDPEGVVLRGLEKEERIAPSVVIVADGGRSSTRDLLGIGKIELSRPTKLAFSIYHDPVDPVVGWWEVVRYRVVHVVKGIFLALKIFFYAWITWQTIEQAASQYMDDGPSGLSRIPKHDYLLRIFREKEQRVIEGYEVRIALLQERVDAGMGGEEELEALRRELQQRLETKSKRLHGVLDFAHSLFNPAGHSMKRRAMEHQRTHLVDVMVGKAERSVVKVGGTTFFLRGDAAHTTDPYSGTGAKTALEEVWLDHYFLSQPLSAREGGWEDSILEWSFGAYQNQMVDKAFEERLDYYLGTELPARFADCALQRGQISAEERDLYIRLAARVEEGGPLTDEERGAKGALEEKLWQLLEDMPAQEEPFFQAAKESLRQGRRPVDRRLPPLLAQWTCAGRAEGWLLQMLLHLASDRPLAM